MHYKANIIKSLLCFFLLFLSNQISASNIDDQLNIHVQYQQHSDTWNVRYDLPAAVELIAFARKSNFDRTKLYRIDESRFFWDKADDVLLIKSIDGSKFTSLNLTFPSFYDFIQKDYTHNIKYSDGSVLLYTNHLALGANIAQGVASFNGTTFHFSAPEQHIIFLGNNYKDKAQWNLKDNGTYVYFGNIKPIENDSMIAIVDPALPKWAWKNTQQYFPKLFDYYKQKTGQSLNFKPVVFFNYDQLNGDYSNYSGGTLDGLVQLTINGKHWKKENEKQFNNLFHFLAHEAAHFWNGQMFAFQEQEHSWMHEGGADTFANFAMMEFGLINYEQMIQKFENAANNCILNKGDESLAQSAKLQRFRNYYSCGAIIGLASHFAIKANNPNQTIFDLWKQMFHLNLEDRTYNHQDYFTVLSDLTGSNKLSNALNEFSTHTSIDNQAAVASWFEQSEIAIALSNDLPEPILKHWGRQTIYNLMGTHCESISFSSYDDYVKTYPIDGCESFTKSMEIQFLDGFDIFREGLSAYNSFKAKCISDKTILLQDRKKEIVGKLKCLQTVEDVKPYMTFKTAL